MRKFNILEHTSDLKIRVFGKSKEELFQNALLGMLKVAKYQKEAKGKIFKTKIKIRSIDIVSLLVNFLNEILYLVETEKIVFEKIEFKKFSEQEIDATLSGKPLKRMGVHIKGVTYHGLEIKKNKEGMWQAEILFDI